MTQQAVNPATIQNQVIGDTRYSMLIGGEWRDAERGRTFDVTNPATGGILSHVPDGTEDDTKAAIDAAAAALPAWSALPAMERGRLLRVLADAMLANTERLATIMTLEEGKPLAESRGEIAYAASFLSWFAGEGERAYGQWIPANAARHRLAVFRQPVGVAALITPWNFPAAMLTRKIGPALAAGCTVVCKPAEATPLSALEFGRLAQEAGIPAGVINIVTTNDPTAFAKPVFADDRVRKVSFTGSTEVGKLLIRQSADGVKRLSLELGGNAPFIVFDDAELDAAVQGALDSKFRNMGQTCICANRIYVQRGIYGRFAEAFSARVSAMKVGNGLEPGITVGPLINGDAAAKVERHIADATANGATIRVGGGRAHPDGNLHGAFWTPTVLENARPDMLVAREETFGPVAPLIPFDTEAEVIASANATPYGLAAYFFSRDVGRVIRVAEALDYGIVGANDALPSLAQAPFGGFKQSGLGREGGAFGIDEYLEVKYLALGM